MLGIAAADGRGPRCTFRFYPDQEPRPNTWHWFHHYRLRDGEPWLSLAKEESGYLLSFSNLADFVVSAGGGDIRGYAGSSVPLESIRHLFLDQVLPMVLSHQGRVVLHAAAVHGPAGAIAFAGVTGQGKSTLAATLGQQGWPVLTDDCLMLEARDGRLWGVPSYPGLRLWGDSVAAVFEDEPALAEVAHYTCKRRVVWDDGQLHANAEAVPLQRLYFLGPPADGDASPAIQIERLSPREAFMALISSTFKLDIADRDMLKREFETLADLAAWPLFYRLSYPRDYACLPAVCEAVLEHIEYIPAGNRPGKGKPSRHRLSNRASCQAHALGSKSKVS